MSNSKQQLLFQWNRVLVCGLLALLAQPALGTEPAVRGRVTQASEPVLEAKVYAYETGSFSFQKVLTDAAGQFLFHGLPAGIYKIIAIKQGFEPAVQRIERTHGAADQRVDLELLGQQDADTRTAEAYWAARRRVPPDILRDSVNGFGPNPIVGAKSGIDMTVGDGRQMEARLGAGAGIKDFGVGGDARITSANVDLKGNAGDVAIGVEGRFQRMDPRAALDHPGGALEGGQAHALALRFQAPTDSEVRLLSSSGEMPSQIGDGTQPVDVEQHQLQWFGRVGENGRSGFTARYLAENNFYQPRWAPSVDIPEASEHLDVEGFYSRSLGDSGSLAMGLAYRQRTSGSGLAEETIGFYGQAGAQIQPRVMVEVGLFSKVRDGSLSLMPQGTFIIDLGGEWRAETSYAQRLERLEEAARFGGFTTARHGDERVCQEAAETCYQVQLAHGERDQPSFTLGAVHREYAETLRVYFSEDFFSQLESLFMVRGDVVPELQVSMVRHITPKILARLESNYGSGGGGIFYATDNRSYENEVRYLVTSLDTQFQRTSTGVFVAFHHLEQSLRPLDSDSNGGAEVEQQRLQLMLTQDLDALLNFSSNWAVRLNMELSRGAIPFALTSGDETVKTLTGGFTVSF